MRGKRKCGTCVCFEPLPDIYKQASCKLPVCKCRMEDKTFGIALCPNYVSQKFLDTSGARVEGHVDGFCRWVPPPVLDSVLWKDGAPRQRNSETSWCHCWQSVQPIVDLEMKKEAPKTVEASYAKGLPMMTNRRRGK